MHLCPFVRPWACWSENEVCSGALLACCYFEATENNCAINQQKTWFKVNGAVFFYFFIFLFKGHVSNMRL